MVLLPFILAPTRHGSTVPAPSCPLRHRRRAGLERTLQVSLFPFTSGCLDDKARLKIGSGAYRNERLSGSILAARQDPAPPSTALASPGAAAGLFRATWSLTKFRSITSLRNSKPAKRDSPGLTSQGADLDFVSPASANFYPRRMNRQSGTPALRAAGRSTFRATSIERRHFTNRVLSASYFLVRSVRSRARCSGRTSRSTTAAADRCGRLGSSCPPTER
jgi:hypothetical protein